MSDLRPQFRMQRPPRMANLPTPLGHQIPRVGENVPIFDPPGFRPDMMGPRGVCHRRIDCKKVRPSQLQNLCKAFDGDGDPYDHVARFRQVLYAEEVDDEHTMVQGFGLTLEQKALSWFQSLSNAILCDFEILIDALIKKNTKTRIKHNMLTQILDF